MRSFSDFLREHRNGATLDELADKLAALVAAVTDEGRGGTLTLAIGIKPIGKGDGLEVTADIKLAEPKPKPGSSIFYATPDNSLIRQDPRQQAMELRSIPNPPEARAI